MACQNESSNPVMNYQIESLKNQTSGRRITPWVLAALIGFILCSHIAFFGWHEWSRISNFDTKLETQNSEAQRLFNAMIDEDIDALVKLATYVATEPHYVQLFAEKKREELLNAVSPSWLRLQDEFGLRQLHFHTPPATSFLRVHRPAKFDDNLSDIRPTIVYTNREQKIARGFEIGRVVSGLRGVVPIYYQDEHIGSIEAGSSHRHLLNRFSKQLDTPAAVFLSRNVLSAKLWKEDLANQPLRSIHSGEYMLDAASDEEFAKALVKQTDLDELLSVQLSAQIEIDSTPYHFNAIPLNNFSKQEIGKVVWVTDLTPMLASLSVERQRDMILISISVILVSIASVFLVNLATRRLHRIIRIRTKQSQQNDQVFMMGFYNSTDATLLIDGEVFVDCNNKTIEMLRASSKEQVLSIHPSDLSPETQPDGHSSHAKAGEMIRTAFERGSNRFEWDHLRLNGDVFPVEVTLMPIPLFDKQLLYCTWKDITKRKQIEAALTETRQAVDQEAHKLRSMIEGMDEGIVFADINDIITEVNGWFLSTMNMQRDDLIGKSLWDFHHDLEHAQRVRNILDRFRTGQTCEPYQANHHVMNRHFSFRAQPIIENDEYHGVILNVIDVTDLIEARQAAEIANQTKTRFLANMSHEFRTPLNGVLGFTELLLRDADNGNCEERREWLHTIARSGKHLLQLSNDVLDLSKIEAGELTVEQINFSHPALIADTASILRPLASEQGLTFEMEGYGPLPETICTDPTRLRQVLMNLISNAIKFTEVGGVTLAVRLDQEGSKTQLVYEVTDTGPGIPDDRIEAVFHPFQQADDSIARKFGGTGLGLSISRSITEALGGSLTVRSELGKGSVFTARIDPGSLDDTKMIRSPFTEVTSSLSPILGVTSKSLPTLSAKILVVDDGETNRKLIGLTMRRAGATIGFAENGQQGVDAALADSFDLIFMDMQMPVMDGYEATRLLREKGFTIPIIALTANAMRDDMQKCLDAGCTAYLSKPIDLDLLVQTVADHLGIRPEQSDYPDHDSQKSNHAGIVAQSEQSGKAEDIGEPEKTNKTDEVNDPIYSTLPMNDPEFREIVTDFVDLLHRQLSQMTQAVEDDNRELLTQLAHRVRGASGMAGLKPLSDSAEQLEVCIDHGEVEGIHSELKNLIRIAQRIEVKTDESSVKPSKTTSDNAHDGVER